MPVNPRASGATLDHILGLQITVAWAGEAGGDPRRLGWWDTDLVDEIAGGDLFRRLLPRTFGWAGLEAVRLAATRKDEAARRRMGQPDRALTLFHWGFAVDEQLRERLAEHRRHGAVPRDVLPTLGVEERFDRARFEERLRGLGAVPQLKAEPAGRRIVGDVPPLDVAASQLAAALAPLEDRYPMPYFLRAE